MTTPIGRPGKSDDLFLKGLEENMKKVAQKLPGTDTHPEKRLQEHRKIRGHEHEDGTEEVILDSDRANDDSAGHNLTEKNLRDHGADKDVEKVTEAQLNDSDGKTYPHRNPEAHERTGDKRPINALDEEMGDAGDDSKLKRYEEASKNDQPKRVLDKDVGKQLTYKKTKIKKAFNLKTSREAASGDYKRYKDGKSYNAKFAAVKSIDEELERIMSTAHAADRHLSEDEKSEILSLKAKKNELLRIPDALQPKKD